MATRIPEQAPAFRLRWDPAGQHAALLASIRLLDRVRGELDVDVLLELHRVMLPPENPYRGRWREGPVVIRLNGVVHRRAPAPEEAARMLAMTLASVNARLTRPLTANEAVKLASKAWFWVTEAHPFRDGNGRVARALATWLLVRHGFALLMDPTTYCQRRKAAAYQAHNRYLTDPAAWRRFFDELVAYCFRRVESNG